mmetsp:Transcript_35821/g.41533  ORF Transcript_35821/g.41533 Transcript_35821/m.41533 type:complete len:122 (+) Transcript_35821:272-637(+)
MRCDIDVVKSAKFNFFHRQVDSLAAARRQDRAEKNTDKRCCLGSRVSFVGKTVHDETILRKGSAFSLVESDRMKRTSEFRFVPFCENSIRKSIFERGCFAIRNATREIKLCLQEEAPSRPE